MKSSPTTPAGLRVQPAGPGDADRVNRLLAAGYARSNGTLDRASEPPPCPARDSDGRPIRFFLATADGVDLGACGVGEKGEVTDWTLTDDPRAVDAGRAMLRVAEAFAREHGAQELIILVAGDDAETIRALDDQKFFESAPPITVMRIVHFRRFLAAVLASRDASSFPVKAFRIEMEPGLYPQLPDPAFRIRAENGKFEIDDGAEAEITLHATATDLSQFLLGGLELTSVLERCRATGPRAGDLRTVLERLAPTRLWYTPLGERR